MVESPQTTTSDTRTAPLPPHPLIINAYAAPEQKREFLSAIFDDTAQDYDRVEWWLSLGTGAWYRRQALLRSGLKPGMRIADVAVGTGLVAEGALKIIGPSGKLIGIDPSPQMMRRATERLGIEAVPGTAEALPFESGSFDFLSMGYALRHVEDINKAFREFHRVLKPEGSGGGGRVCILEITRPRTAFGRACLKLHLATLSRVLGTFFRLAPRTPELWAYYWETIEKCLPPERVMQALTDAGFTDVKRKVYGGIFSEYTGTRA